MSHQHQGDQDIGDVFHCRLNATADLKKNLSEHMLSHVGHDMLAWGRATETLTPLLKKEPY